MSLVWRGDYAYGKSQSDIRTALIGYSANGYPATHFTDAECICGNRVFILQIDDNAGVAARTCAACEAFHIMADGAEYAKSAELEDVECLCDRNQFEITVGLALYEGTDDVRWFYIGCRCIACDLTGCYGDWKNEYLDYRKLLTLV